MNMMIQKLSFGRIATFDDYLKNGDEKQLGKLMDFLKSQKVGNEKVHTEEGARANAAMDGLIEKVGMYVSTEGEPAIKAYEAELMGTGKKKGRKNTKPDSNPVSEKKNQEEFEAMKRKTKNIVLGMIAVTVAAVAGLVIYKAHCMQ